MLLPLLRDLILALFNKFRYSWLFMVFLIFNEVQFVYLSVMNLFMKTSLLLYILLLLLIKLMILLINQLDHFNYLFIMEIITGYFE